MLIVCAVSQTIMTARSGASVTNCVRIVLEHTSAVVWMDTSWSNITYAKPMCQVWPICAVMNISPPQQTTTKQTVQKSDYH